MTEPVDKFFGLSMSEYIKRVPNELSQDAVGLWQIIPSLRERFGIDDPGELRAYATLVILELLARGAVPVEPGNPKKTGYYWIEKWWGDTPEEIAKAILDDWERFGEDPVFWDDRWAWFATGEIKRLAR